MIDPQAASILAAVNRDPPLDTFGVEGARRLAAARPKPEESALASVEDLMVGPRPVPVRLYRPQRDVALPAIVFAHGGGATMWAVPNEVPHTRDIRRIRDEHFGGGDRSGLMTLAFAARGPQFTPGRTAIDDWLLAREVQRMREEHDPIEQVRARLIREFKVGEDELKAIDAKVREIVNDAAEFATHDPEPDPSELYTDILLEPAQG